MDASDHKPPKQKSKAGSKSNSKKQPAALTKTAGKVLKQESITDHLPVVKQKRKIDRFNGMPEDEVILKTLPDRLAPDLDILIIGINPGLYAAYIGHHYAGPGNHFWKCLYLSGLVPEPMNCYDDIKLLELGIGFTNMCERTTRGSADLKRAELEEGGRILVKKIQEYRPKIAVFNGKGIYQVFSGNKNMLFGKQEGLIEGTSTIAFVMPSSSARCAQLPRAVDKVPFYEALRHLRDYVVGRIAHLDPAAITFPTLELKNVKKVEVQEGDSAPGAPQSNDHKPSPRKRGRAKGKDSADGDSQIKGQGQPPATQADKQRSQGAKVKCADPPHFEQGEGGVERKGGQWWSLPGAHSTPGGPGPPSLPPTYPLPSPSLPPAYPPARPDHFGLGGWGQGEASTHFGLLGQPCAVATGPNAMATDFNAAAHSLTDSHSAAVRIKTEPADQPACIMPHPLDFSRPAKTDLSPQALDLSTQVKKEPLDSEMQK